MAALFGLLILLGIIYFTWWQNTRLEATESAVLFVISSVIIITVSANWMDDYPGVVVALWGLAVFHVYKAVAMVMMAGGPSRGWSQFKGYWNKIKNKE